jgi:hypothetical protein
MTATKLLIPKKVITDEGWNPIGAANEALACDPLDELHDDDTTRAQAGSGASGVTTIGMQHDLGFTGRMAAISSLKIYGRARRSDGSNINVTLRIKLGGNSSTSGNFTLTASYQTFEYDITSVRPGGGNWSEADLRDPTFEFQFIRSSITPTTLVTSLYGKVVYTPASIALEQHRLVASQKLLSRLHQVFPTLRLPLRFLDLDVLEDFMLSDPRYPASDGNGRGVERWQRLLLRCLRANVDPMTNTVNVTAIDLRKYLSLFWDVGQSKISSQRTDVADGIARLSTGGTREFNRASKAYGPDASGIALVEFGVDEEAIVKEGMQLERASTNRIWNSAFGNGFTNYTLLNDGVDGVDVTLDTMKTLFEATPEIATRQSAKILTGASTQGGIEQITDTSFGASAKSTVSVWHDDDAGAQLSLRVKNEATGNWLQSNGSWGVSEVDAITFANRSTKTRDFLHFTMEGTPGDLRIRMIGLNTGAKVSHVYHLQAEEGPPTSEMVSGAADKTREISKLKVSNNFRKRVLWTAHGYLVCEIVPNFSDAELASAEEKMIFRAAYDGSNIDEFLYKQGTGFAFRRTVGGSADMASKATTAVRGTAYRVAFRWTGSEGELGLTDYTLSVFVAGVKGTDAVAGGAPTPPSTMDAWIGQDGSDGKTLDAALRRLKMGPVVFSDAEMARMV